MIKAKVYTAKQKIELLRVNEVSAFMQMQQNYQSFSSLCFLCQKMVCFHVIGAVLDVVCTPKSGRR